MVSRNLGRVGGEAGHPEVTNVFPFIRLTPDEERHEMGLLTEEFGGTLNHGASAGDDYVGGFRVVVERDAYANDAAVHGGKVINATAAEHFADMRARVALARPEWVVGDGTGEVLKFSDDAVKLVDERGVAGLAEGSYERAVIPERAVFAAFESGPNLITDLPKIGKDRA